MDSALKPAPASEVRALIASLVLTEDSPTRIGSVTLTPHQTDAVARIQSALDEFRGAFLCDAVGSGKTYIGLAVARHMKKPVVIAPAALRGMWTAAAAATCAGIQIISIESLSGKPVVLDACDGLIVDEAHHFRNSSTKRYRSLSRLARNRPVLLMTATPVHNSREDFENLGAIFLGTRARHLSALEITRLVIRRDKTHVRIGLPETRPTLWLTVGDDHDTVGKLQRLPPPIPLRDAGEANALVSHGLIRQWASSEAALTAALKRRIAQATALESALEAGEYPTRTALRSWIVGDDAIQLVIPELFTSRKLMDSAPILEAIRAHSEAVRELISRRKDGPALDDERAALLSRIACSHSGQRIVAFASYEATVVSLFGRLLHSHRAACLTSRGARVAAGRISRDDAVAQFDPRCTHVNEAERIDLLLTTDLLSEGVNLQNAAVVVHLDVPWTAARLEQRAGRVARLGSLVSSVAVYGLKPPASAERVLRGAALVSSKWQCAAECIGVTQNPGLAADHPIALPAAPEAYERTRAILARWLGTSRIASGAPLVAAVSATRSGFLALIERGQALFLLCEDNGITSDPARVCAVAERASGSEVPLDRKVCDEALARIAEWTDTKQAASNAGIGEDSFVRNRRKVFARINTFASHSAPQTRFAQSRKIERLRALAARTLGSEDERALDEIDLSSNLPFEDAAFGTTSFNCDDAHYTVRALLLLVSAR